MARRELGRGLALEEAAIESALVPRLNILSRLLLTLPVFEVAPGVEGSAATPASAADIWMTLIGSNGSRLCFPPITCGLRLIAIDETSDADAMDSCRVRDPPMASMKRW